MRKAGEVTFADIIKSRPGEGYVFFFQKKKEMLQTTHRP